MEWKTAKYTHDMYGASWRTLWSVRITRRARKSLNWAWSAPYSPGRSLSLRHWSKSERGAFSAQLHTNSNRGEPLFEDFTNCCRNCERNWPRNDCDQLSRCGVSHPKVVPQRISNWKSHHWQAGRRFVSTRKRMALRGEGKPRDEPHGPDRYELSGVVPG